MEEQSAMFGVKQVAGQLHERLRRYLEAQYHIRDSSVIEERRALLSEVGSIAQEPYLETTPTYQRGGSFADLGLPAPVGDTLTELSAWDPNIGVFPRLFAHQADALQSFFRGGHDLVVATGTGSGKTETFLYAILGQLLLEAAHRPDSFRLPGCRALLLYPMNALVSDQLSRLRRLFGDERLARLFIERYGRCGRFGMYTSRTPYPGQRKSSRDRRDVYPLLEYYRSLEHDASQAILADQLRERGRWPAKDLDGFYGQDDEPAEQRLLTQPSDRELLTRHEMHRCCPDILITNYSMLEYMLLRPIERSIFRRTTEWLESDSRNSLLLVLDEAHMYRGAAGAEVALLIRRLQARIGIPREQLRCILTSASLPAEAGSEAAIEAFATGLTGCRELGGTFHIVVGRQQERNVARLSTPDDVNHLASFDAKALHERIQDPARAADAVITLAQQLRWDAPAVSARPTSEDVSESALRHYLYRNLSGWEPVEQLIRCTTGNAVSLGNLARRLFPRAESASAEKATETLLALGTYAHDGERPLLSTRVHLLFRGVPSLYACINPRCNKRRYRPGEELLLGRLYTEPRTHCDCDAHARVYELYTHRDCGASFLRAFGRGRHANFYWHEQGGDLSNEGQPLVEDLLLVPPSDSPMDPSRARKIQPIWLEMSTGRVETDRPPNPENYRMLWRPSPSAVQNDDEPADELSPSVYKTCPACGKRSVAKIMDLATKGEQPFATLIQTQFALQPASRPRDSQYPNGGRKVLLFSDGRQKAARLARDLPREVEFDSFRQALVVAVDRLQTLGIEPRLDRRLYTAFVSVCYDAYLHFFDREGGSQQILLDHIRRYREYYDADLEIALDEWGETPPQQYRQALLRQLCDPFYSLYAACAAVVEPTRRALLQLRRALIDFPEDFLAKHLASVASVWSQALLEQTAFDLDISEPIRRHVDRYFRPLAWGEAVPGLERVLTDAGILSSSQVSVLEQKLYDVLARRDPVRGAAYLDPGSLALRLALDDKWYRCHMCGLSQYRPLLGYCNSCGSNMLEECPPDHPYMTSRKGYFREALREVLAGAQPIHMTAEEHTAQLSQRDAGVVHATTEEYELRFQDVSLGPDKPPIDVLSCTTTMEVGVDIGSLTAVGLRNVPPQRENYQQRSGRSGRRAAAVSTVLTYAQGGAHDSYYFAHPLHMISGPPREPRIKIDNHRLARRHLHSLLIQTFFHNQLDQLPRARQEELEARGSNLFSSLGLAASFFHGDGLFSLAAFRRWAEEAVVAPSGQVADTLATWLPDELWANDDPSPSAKVAHRRDFAKRVAIDFIASLEALARTYPGEMAEEPVQPRRPTGKQANPMRHSSGTQRPARGHRSSQLLDVLFDSGLLPTYSFPRDLCTFYVFDQGSRAPVRIKERVQQSKDKALSEYAPGRLLVVNKETFRVGGIYVEGMKTGAPGRRLLSPDSSLGVYVCCARCTYVRLEQPCSEGELCPICGAHLQQHEMLDPPGFSPSGGRPVDETDRDQEISYATSAQFPVPVGTDEFDWESGVGEHLRYTHEQNRRLVIVNKGPFEYGFAVCSECGAAWPWDEGEQLRGKQHRRPFLVEHYVLRQENLGSLCSGPIHAQPLYLGHSFLTDLLLLRVPLCSPINAAASGRWLHDALRSAGEAIALAASRFLDIDPDELSAGYRLMPPMGEEGVDAYADIYLFDTASGGAGYAAEAGEKLPDVLSEALRLLHDCPAACERSCTKCLRHYGNRFWHERLDRRLAEQLVLYARDGLCPPVVPVAEQRAQLAPLRRYLELEGWEMSPCSETTRVEVPLLVRARAAHSGGRQDIAVGTYPALLDPQARSFLHPLEQFAAQHDLRLVLLRDYVVSRDLPTAYRRLLASI